MGDEVEFFPADKHKSFLEDGCITLGVISQTDPKYQKQSVYNIFAISTGKHEEWSWFFGCWQMLKVFSNWYYRLRCVARHAQITLNNKFAISLQHVISLKVASLQCLYNISKKKLWMEFSIFDGSYRFLTKVSRNVQSTRKRKFVKF